MTKREAGIHCRSRASREVTNVDVEGGDAQVDTHGQGARFEELNDALYVEPAYKQLCSALHEEKNPNFYMRCAGTHTGSRRTTYRDQIRVRSGVGYPGDLNEIVL